MCNIPKEESSRKREGYFVNSIYVQANAIAYQLKSNKESGHLKIVKVFQITWRQNCQVYAEYQWLEM